MTNKSDKKDIGPGALIALSAAALVLNLAEITLIGVVLAAIAIGIAHLFNMMQHNHLNPALLIGGAFVCIPASMILIATRNVPFLCKQFGAASSQVARIIANIGAVVWILACLMIYMTSSDKFSIGTLPIYLGLLGGAATQLLMGYRRGTNKGLQDAETPAVSNSLTQTQNTFDAVVQLLDKPADSAPEGGTITLPTTEEIKQEM